MQFEKLPKDMRLEVIRKLDPFDIFHACKMNKETYQLCQSDPIVGKILELAQNTYDFVTEFIVMIPSIKYYRNNISMASAKKRIDIAIERAEYITDDLLKLFSEISKRKYHYDTVESTLGVETGELLELEFPPIITGDQRADTLLKDDFTNTLESLYHDYLDIKKIIG